VVDTEQKPNRRSSRCSRRSCCRRTLSFDRFITDQASLTLTLIHFLEPRVFIARHHSITAMLTRDVDIAIPSVCLSVRPSVSMPIIYIETA